MPVSARYAPICVPGGSSPQQVTGVTGRPSRCRPMATLAGCRRGGTYDFLAAWDSVRIPVAEDTVLLHMIVSENRIRRFPNDHAERAQHARVD